MSTPEKYQKKHSLSVEKGKKNLIMFVQTSQPEILNQSVNLSLKEHV
jgi:hypothetical protein